MKRNLNALFLMVALSALAGPCFVADASFHWHNFPAVGPPSVTLTSLETIPQDWEKLCAPFSISGVYLGMTREEVLRKLGEPNKSSTNSSCHWKTIDCLNVHFDNQGIVTSIYGDHLERDGVDYTPKHPHGALPEELEEMLGKETWQQGERGDFAFTWGYQRFDLVLKCGCGGWVFILDSAPLDPQNY